MTTNGVKYTVSMEVSKPKPVITQINKESLMLMMKEIMQKSSIVNDQLHCVVQESNQCSESMVQNLLIDQLQQCQENKEFQQDKNPLQKENFKKELNQVENISTQKLLNNLAKSGQQIPNISDSQIQKSKSPSHCKNTEESSQSSNQTSQFDKLIEITSRCIEYYNNFIKQKSVEFAIIQKTFTDLNCNLDMAFGEIISQAQRKQKQLKEFLLKKYKEIIDYRQFQDNGLKDTLQNIRSVHLNNIIKKQASSKDQNSKDTKRKLFLSLNSKIQTQSSAIENSVDKNLLNSYESQQSINLSTEMHNYATTLNQFYLQMEQIQKSNFKQMVEQSVSFINNLICQELKVLMTERIPSKLCEKRMLRQNSKDFLMDENQNQVKNNINGQNLAFLDFQSFTKLFMDNSKHNNADQQMAKDNKKIQEIISLIQQKNKPQTQKRLNTYCNQKVLTNLNSNQLKKQKSKEKNSNSRPKTTYQVKAVLKKQSYLSSDRSNKSLNKTTNFSKKDHPNEQIIPTTQKIQTEDVHKQNSLQLIKKISSQQNNRSAKIKSYMVSFQDTTNKQKVSIKKDQITKQQNKMIKNSKSPCKLSKTPTKMTKSIEKKGLISSVHQINSSSDIKFKSSQQTSLKNSRNSGYVSEFKIATSRRQSVALK